MSRINRNRRIAMLSPLAFALAFGAYAQEDHSGHDMSAMTQMSATADAAPSTQAYIAANAEIAPRDFQDAPSLADRGGILQARAVLGPGLNAMLDDLQGALVA